jgi:hypothetical protein
VDGFLLEAASDLAPPATWNPVTNPVLSASGQLSVALPSIGPMQFHRLKPPRLPWGISNLIDRV